MLRRIDHIALKVSDLDRSMDFYCRTLGFVEVARWASEVPGVDGIAFLELGGTRLELIAQKDGHGQRDEGAAGMRHICLRADDLDQEMGRLAAAGARIVKGAHTIDGTMYHETLSHRDYPIARGLRRALIEDPDGVTIELLEG